MLRMHWKMSDSHIEFIAQCVVNRIKQCVRNKDQPGDEQ